MPDWDNSRAPQLGDRRVSPGCWLVFIATLFVIGLFAVGFIRWLEIWK